MKTADVVVIGGGIHGCSTALHLALRGLKTVLIEKDYAGRHASGVNAGGVRQLARDIAEIPLSLSSMDLWERMGDLVGDDCGFESHGTVLVAESEEELAGFRERVADLRLRGFSHEELIDRKELKRLVPAVADHCPGGVVSRRDGAADPFRTTQAFRRRAVELGAEVREGVAVTGLTRAGSVWRVETSDGTIESPRVVNAAGAWADRIAAMLGEPVPLAVVAPMLMVTSRLPAFIKPVVILRGRKLSFKQLDNGTVVIGGGHLAAPYRPKRDGDRLAQARDQRRHGVGAVSGHARRHHRARLGRHRSLYAGRHSRGRAERDIGGSLPPVRLLDARLPARAGHGGGDGRAGRDRQDEHADRGVEHHAVRGPGRVAIDAQVVARISRMPRKARLYPATPKPAIMPLLARAVSETGPRRTGFEIWTSMVGKRTCEIAATSAG